MLINKKYFICIVINNHRLADNKEKSFQFMHENVERFRVHAERLNFPFFPYQREHCCSFRIFHAFPFVTESFLQDFSSSRFSLNSHNFYVAAGSGLRRICFVPTSRAHIFSFSSPTHLKKDVCWFTSPIYYKLQSYGIMFPCCFSHCLHFLRSSRKLPRGKISESLRALEKFAIIYWCVSPAEDASSRV